MRVGGDGASLAAADELAEKASSASALSELDLRLSFDGRRCKEEPLWAEEE